MILFKNRPASSSLPSTVAALRLKKDMEDLVTRRYSAEYTQYYVSNPYSDENKIIVPVLFKVKRESGGIYSGAIFDTEIILSSCYPFKAPTMRVKNQVYHPNINIDSGAVDLDMLQDSKWIPTFTVNSIIFAFETILNEPNLNLTPGNPVNLEMVNMLLYNPEEFFKTVVCTLQGGCYLNRYFFEQDYGTLPFTKRSKGCYKENTKRSRYETGDTNMNVEYCLDIINLHIS